MTTDWPAIIARLERRKVNLRALLNVSRVTLWYWRTGRRKPNGDHAVQIILMDRTNANHC
jgi:hypothetical protein